MTAKAQAMAYPAASCGALAELAIVTKAMKPPSTAPAIGINHKSLFNIQTP